MKFRRRGGAGGKGDWDRVLKGGRYYVWRASLLSNLDSPEMISISSFPITVQIRSSMFPVQGNLNRIGPDFFVCPGRAYIAVGVSKW